MRLQPGHAALSALCKRARAHAKQGPAVYARFLASPEFKRGFDALPPALWRRAIQLINEAERLCRERDPLPPPVAPKPVGASRRPRWKDPAQQARLRAVWAKTGDVVATARILRVSEGSARLALKRYVLNGTTVSGAQAA